MFKLQQLLERYCLPALLPMGVVFFYAIPGLLSYFLMNDEFGMQVFWYSALAILCYVVMWFGKLDQLITKPLLALPKARLNFGLAAYLILASYTAFTLYVFFTAPAVPLIDAINGKSIDELSIGRETFLRARTGWEAGLNYGYAMYRSFLMPFAVCLLYWKRLPLRHVALVGFLVSLMLTLEKSVAIFALLPVMYLLFKTRSYVGVAAVVALFLGSMAATSFLARGGNTHTPVIVVAPTGEIIATTGPLETDAQKDVQINAQVDALTDAQKDVQVNAQVDAITDALKDAPTNISELKDLPPETVVITDTKQSMAYIPQQYNIFTGNSQVEYVLNRIFYIPYITSKEWLRYRHEVLHDEYTLGRSISIIAKIMGEPKLNLEREVFNFQWGQNETGTGSANTTYYIDAFLNFGIAGIILYTFVVVCIVRLAMNSSIKAVEACIFVPALFLLFNSLTAMIFSGGLFLMILVVLLFRDEAQEAPAPEVEPAVSRR